MDPMLISLSVFIAVFALIIAVLFVMQDLGKSKVEDRLQVLTGGRGQDDDDDERKILKREMLKAGVGGTTTWFGKIVSKFGNLPLFLSRPTLRLGSNYSPPSRLVWQGSEWLSASS